MRFLPNSNAVIAILRGHAGVLARLRQQHLPQEVGISAIVAHELFYGTYRSRRRNANLARVDALRFDVLEPAREDTLCAG